MGLLDKLRRKKSPIPPKAPEQTVIVYFRYGSTNLERLFALEDELEAAIAKSSAGQYDGNEVNVDGSDGFLYMYGPDADLLFRAVQSTLEACPFMKGANVKIRYGPPANDVRQREVVIDA